MLIRVAPRFFQASTGDTVTIAAVAQNNGGFEGATFMYAGGILTNTQVQNHPACQFVAVHGVETFAAMLLFDDASPGASYDLSEVDPAGNLLPLVNGPASAGRFTQFQIDGLPVASLAAATRGEQAAALGATARAAAAGGGQPMATGAGPVGSSPRRAAKRRSGRKSAKRSRP
jgi:hypothetical protein